MATKDTLAQIDAMGKTPGAYTARHTDAEGGGTQWDRITKHMMEARPLADLGLEDRRILKEMVQAYGGTTPGTQAATEHLDHAWYVYWREQRGQLDLELAKLHSELARREGIKV